MVEQNPDGLGGSPERSDAYPSFEPPRASDPAAARYGPAAPAPHQGPQPPPTAPNRDGTPRQEPGYGAHAPGADRRYPPPGPTASYGPPPAPTPLGPGTPGRPAPGAGDGRRALIIGGVVGLALLLVVVGFSFARGAVAPPQPEPLPPMTATPAPTRTITVRPSPAPTSRPGSPRPTAPSGTPTPTISIDSVPSDLPDEVGDWRLAGPRGPFGVYARDSVPGSVELMWLGDLTSVGEWARTLEDPVLSRDGRSVCGSFGYEPTCYVQTRAGVFQAWSGDGVPVGELAVFSEEFARLMG